MTKFLIAHDEFDSEQSNSKLFEILNKCGFEVDDKYNVTHSGVVVGNLMYDKEYIWFYGAEFADEVDVQELFDLLLDSEFIITELVDYALLKQEDGMLVIDESQSGVPITHCYTREGNIATDETWYQYYGDDLVPMPQTVYKIDNKYYVEATDDIYEV